MSGTGWQGSAQSRECSLKCYKWKASVAGSNGLIAAANQRQLSGSSILEFLRLLEQLYTHLHR